ncbi:hypothetical protein [Actinomadura sp. SCN-SB]
MFPQPKKYGQYLALIVLGIYVFNNPVQAADFVTQLVAAVNEFANGLG